MRTYDWDDTPYENLPSMQARFAAIEEARWMAEDEEDIPAPERDFMIPFERDDPRYDAWVNRRNELRAERGLTPLEIIDWQDSRNRPIGVIKR